MGTYKNKTINSSVFLNKRDNVWWLTITYDEEVSIKTSPDAPVVGVDVGIANFITTSTGKHYGTMQGRLKERHKRDRAKRRRKAKLRACLRKKGVKKLPSTSSRTGQRIIRQTKQEINRASRPIWLFYHAMYRVACSVTSRPVGCFVNGRRLKREIGHVHIFCNCDCTCCLFW